MNSTTKCESLPRRTKRPGRENALIKLPCVRDQAEFCPRNIKENRPNDSLIRDQWLRRLTVTPPTAGHWGEVISIQRMGKRSRKLKGEKNLFKNLECEESGASKEA